MANAEWPKQFNFGKNLKASLMNLASGQTEVPLSIVPPQGVSEWNQTNALTPGFAGQSSGGRDGAGSLGSDPVMLPGSRSVRHL